MTVFHSSPTDRSTTMSISITTDEQLQATPFDDEVGHRELDSRSVDGITVVLLWRPGDAHVLIRVDDERSGVRMELAVPPADALEAFHHPFAYAG